jgi:hypothetical protein
MEYKACQSHVCDSYFPYHSPITFLILFERTQMREHRVACDEARECVRARRGNLIVAQVEVREVAVRGQRVADRINAAANGDGAAATGAVDAAATGATECAAAALVVVRADAAAAAAAAAERIPL